MFSSNNKTIYKVAWSQLERKQSLGGKPRSLHFCDACSGASDKHECIPPALRLPRAKWLQCSLNINNLNLQMNSRHKRTRSGRLFFLALYGNFQRNKLQPTMEISLGIAVSGASGVSLYSLPDWTCSFPIIVTLKPQKLQKKSRA